MEESLITVHYGELALKGSNRSEFENILISNIKKAISGEGYEKIEKKQLRVLIHLSERSEVENIIKKLKTVFGISWFSYALSCKPDLEEMKDLVLKNTPKGRTVKVNTKRADKSFPLTSPEINNQIGQVLYNYGFKIDIKNPQTMIHIEILKDRANIFFDKIAGLGGLPVGSTGRVLCLLSGGIDSPVAAWLMLKRGCIVDYLHVHPFSSSEEVKSSKIIELIKKLNEFSQRNSKLFVLPYHELYKKTFEIGDRNELIVFRRFILSLANILAKEQGYLGIVTGDNLAQVASQTLHNLYTTNEASALPVYRPVLTYDKEEIINLAKKIATYELSLKPYRDCCSLVAAKHPATKVKLEDAKEIEEKIEINKIIEKTLEKKEINKIIEKTLEKKETVTI